MKTAAPTTATAREALAAAIEQKDQELTALKNALAWLNAADMPAGSAPVERQAASKPERKPKAERSPKKSKKATGPKASRRAAAADDDVPIARKGKMPTKGVQQLYCETLADRQAQLAKLKAAGFQRVGPTDKIVPGTFDVRPSGDGDDSCVVLWRAQAHSGRLTFVFVPIFASSSSSL